MIATLRNEVAFLLLDYQVGLCESGPHLVAPPLAEQVQDRGVLASATKVLHAAREAGLFVAHVRLAFEATYALRTNYHHRFDVYPKKGLMLAGSPEAQIVAPLAPIEGEPVVAKTCVDPFIGTPLMPVLHAQRIRHIVLGGVATNLVVESAARHACDAGLQVTVVEDLCASFDPDLHDLSMSKIMPMFATIRNSADLLGELS